MNKGILNSFIAMGATFAMYILGIGVVALVGENLK
jgi:hypothetical protein